VQVVTPAEQWAACALLLVVSIWAPAPALAQGEAKLPPGSAHDQVDPVAAARTLFHAGKFSEGLALLNKDNVRGQGEPSKRAIVLVEIARFYERYAGDFDEAGRYLKEVIELGLAPDASPLRAAQQNLQRLNKQAARYRKENETLLRISLERFESHVARARVAELEAFIRKNPDYPRLASAYYYLGKNLLQLKQDREAHPAFKKALELRPALGFHLPIEHTWGKVEKRLLRNDLLLAVRVVLGILGGVWLILFILSRPWRALGLRQGILLLALIALWWVFFKASVWIAGRAVPLHPEYFAKPVYLSTAPGAALSDALGALFLHGLAGVVGIFIIVVSSARFRRRRTWTVVNAVASLLLMSSLMTVFYLQHGDGAFRPGAGDRFPRLGGVFYYATPDPEPFILTNPLAYCRFQETVGELDEVRIRQWFKRYAKVCKER